MKSLQGNVWCSWRALGDLETSAFPFRIVRNHSKYLSTKFGKVNPARTEAGLNGCKGILDAVDELFEAFNHQIFWLALLYIFQFISLPSLTKSILVGSKLYKKSSRERLMQLTSSWRLPTTKYSHWHYSTSSKLSFHQVWWSQSL